jgi:Protein of unknown function (DUF1553)/Protein of unknown function (DUF1549)/Planctomycete cytochrome C
MKFSVFQNSRYFLFSISLLLLLLLLANWVGLSKEPVHFNTQVKPIFNKKCISCHGGVKKNGGFSMMNREELLRPNESGKPAIVPGKPNESELMRRVTHHDPEERMPYEAAPLSNAEIATLRQWIKEGAVWGTHWAYVPVQPVQVPALKGFLGLFPQKNSDWAKSDIDKFILAEMQKQGLNPSPKADKATLLRRVSLDLIGMPAPDDIAKAYLQDQSPAAYDKLVDALLASPRFGERWASMWLDIARYADTKGYERDPGRQIWHYRDWLIRALNRDMPYNQFLTEQIAGDLLPNPSDEQYLATAFHRNTTTNDEGGTDNEEFRVAAVVDRINTTFEGLLGTTFACTQCHGHPYEDIKHEEYYRVMAYFNNARDEDTYEEYPLLRHYPTADSVKLDSLCKWVAKVSTPKRSMEMYTFLKTLQPSIYSIAGDQFVNAELYDTKTLVMRKDGVARFKQVGTNGASKLICRLRPHAEGGTWEIHADSVKGPLVLQFKLPSPEGGWRNVELDIKAPSGKHDLYWVYRNPGIQDLTKGGVSFDWFYFTQPFPGKDDADYAKYQADFWHLLNADPPSTPVMVENPSFMQRKTQVFERGNWLVKGKEVEPGVPKIMGTVDKNAPNNRLGFARWLSSAENPLTARTFVNRLWEQVFGMGLVETLEDMGSQGTTPTHPELLDYLAWQFTHQQKWSIKTALKNIVSSNTYQQRSETSPQLREKDPYNRYYARGPRVRLSAEQVRDQAMVLSGLLSTKMYGPGVMPYQPEGIWASPYGNEKWVLSQGEDRYRRSVYTYHKRTSAYPSMLTFDGTSRNVCTARRIRTNTPLQALVTLNDPVYVEAAQALAKRMRYAGAEVDRQIARGYYLALKHKIDPKKGAILAKLYQKALAKYQADLKLTQELLGDQKVKNPAEYAALTIVANAILNLDEVITKS